MAVNVLTLMTQQRKLHELFIVWSANIILIGPSFPAIGLYKALETCCYLLYGEWIFD